MHKPFRGLASSAWRRLALLLVLLFYLAYLVMAVRIVGVLKGAGGDFFAYWSVGKIADQYGFHHIYDLELLSQIQSQALHGSPGSSSTTSLIPAAYLDIYLLPFKFISRMDPGTGYWVWLAFNSVAIVGYLFYFARKVSLKLGLQPNLKGILVFLMLSPPVCANLFMGQMGLVLIICSGELIRAALEEKPWLCGLWLGGLMLKPPLLVLVLPGLLLMKNWKVLWGFTISTAVIVTSSVLLTGWQGILAMVNLWIGNTPLPINTNPGSMVNWRMLGLNLNQIFHTSAGWWLTGLGMSLSLVAWGLLLLKQPKFGSPQWVNTLMGIFAISCAFTWHSHIHMMVVIFPFLLFSIILEDPAGLRKGLEAWVLGTPFVFLVGILLTALMENKSIPRITGVAGFLTGLTGLAFYLYITWKVLPPRSESAAALERLTSRPGGHILTLPVSLRGRVREEDPPNSRSVVKAHERNKKRMTR